MVHSVDPDTETKENSMSSTSHLTDEQRARLREKQRLDTAALSAHAVATARLEAAQAHRAEILAREDALVREAKATLAAATTALVARVGVEQASLLTGVPVEVKRGPGRPPTAQVVASERREVQFG